jgi:hypothetical protein
MDGEEGGKNGVKGLICGRRRKRGWRRNDPQKKEKESQRATGENKLS